MPYLAFKRFHPKFRRCLGKCTDYKDSGLHRHLSELAEKYEAVPFYKGQIDTRNPTNPRQFYN